MVGHLPEWLGLANAKDVLGRLLRYAERCGPVARVRLGPVDLVLVADGELARRVLDDERANHKGAAYILTRAVLDNVLLLNGAEWAAHRKTYRAALRGVDPVSRARAIAAAELGRISRGTLRLDAFVSRILARVVSRFVAGIEPPVGFEPHRALIQHELAGLGIDLQCQPWTYLDPRRWTRLRHAVAETRRLFRAAIEERLATHDPTRPSDVLDGFRALADEGSFPRGVEAAVDAVVNFFFTAHDVLTSSTTFALHLLARSPSVADRLREELSRASDDESVLLHQVVRESLRLFPGYALFGRTLQADTEIGGYQVPRGTLLIVSPWVTHRLERHFPNASEFRPERWAAEGRSPVSVGVRDHFLPFGSGHRACLASHLAVPILRTTVAETVRALTLRAPNVEPTIAYWGTAYVEGGLFVDVDPRR
jgi:cytochrome P450